MLQKNRIYLYSDARLIAIGTRMTKHEIPEQPQEIPNRPHEWIPTPDHTPEPNPPATPESEPIKRPEPRNI